MRSLAGLVTLAVLAVVQPAMAQSYPSKPLRLIVPFAPGGSADFIARPLAQKLGAALGQSVVVDNRGGALTIIGAEAAAKSPPDGYTLYLMPGTHVLIPFLVRKVPFDPMNDFTPIALLGSQPYVFLSEPKQPFSTLNDMITYAKANPGKLSIGVSDAVTRTAAESLIAATKIELTVVNYKGGGALANDLVAGHIQLGIGTPPLYLSFQKDKRLNALAVSVPRRLFFLPDIPTVAEAAGVAGYDIQTWYAIAGPAGMSRALVERLHGEIRKTIAEPDMRRRLVDLGVEPSSEASPDTATAMMKTYAERMGKLIQAAGIKPE